MFYWILEWSFGQSSHLLVIMLFFEPWGTVFSWFLVSLPYPWKNLPASQVVLLNTYSSMVPGSTLDGLKWFPILHSIFWVEIYHLHLERSRIIWMCKRDHGDYMEHPYRKNSVVYKNAYNMLSAMLQFSKWLWKQYIFILIMIFWCSFNHMWILLAAVVFFFFAAVVQSIVCGYFLLSVLNVAFQRLK